MSRHQCGHRIKITYTDAEPTSASLGQVITTCPKCGRWLAEANTHPDAATDGDRITTMAQEASRIADALRKIAGILEEMLDATETETDTDQEGNQDHAIH